jgi:mannose-6-phosphate isomerase-like protein (cupin superfamily)
MIRKPHTLPLAVAALLSACSGSTEVASPEAPAEVAGAEAPSAPTAVQDAVTAAPSVYTVLHEDERARVVDMKLEAGVTDGVHMHPDEVVYFLQGGSAKIALPDGNAMEVEVKDGQVLSHEGWTHTVSNTGDDTIHAIIVELQKPSGARTQPEQAKQADQASPDVYRVLHQDDRARVVEMTLKAGARDNPHGHPDEVVYFIKGGKAKIHLPDGKALDVEIPDGHILSNEAWEHTVENVGDSDIVAIIWELT